MTRVVYIMGAGRSGSTILGTVLGNAADVFFAGELDAYARRDGTPTGQSSDLDVLWNAVARSLHKPAQPTWHEDFEHPRGLLRMRGKGRRARLVAYRQFNEALYRTIAGHTDAKVVVDSSHYPLRRWHLRDLDDVDVFTIHLIRDPRDAVRSLQTDIRPKTRAGANAYLWAVHMLSELVYSTLNKRRRMRLRYEDLLRDPDGTLARIAEWCDLDVSPVKFDCLKTGPAFAGNRIITQPTVALQPAPAEGERPSDRATSCVQTPWLIRYGYAPRARNLTSR